jgi:phosphomannomutase
MAADAFSGGYMAAGGRAYRLGACAPQSVRYAVRSLDLSGGCAVRVEGGELVLDLYAERGAELPLPKLRALKQAYYRRDGVPAAMENIPAPVEVRGVRQQRCNEFRQMARVQDEMGFYLHIDANDAAVLREAQIMLSPYVTLVDQPDGVVSARIAPDGEGFTLVDELGNTVPSHRLAQIFAPIAGDLAPNSPLYLPSDATSAMEAVAASMGIETVRAHSSRHALMELLSQNDDLGKRVWDAVYFDAAAALLLLCAHLARSRVALSKLLAGTNAPHMRAVSFAMPNGGKASAMRGLIDNTQGMDVTLDHGMRLRTGGGWALVFPSDDAPEFRVISEGYSSEAADELAGFCIDLLRKTQKE